MIDFLEQNSKLYSIKLASIIVGPKMQNMDQNLEFFLKYGQKIDIKFKILSLDKAKNAFNMFFLMPWKKMDFHIF